ncbi:MAG: phosphodiester glycosidase family protein [Candidatus Limivicinus sp.]|jgi:exopolysaccharide biosynthesis protein
MKKESNGTERSPRSAVVLRRTLCVILVTLIMLGALLCGAAYLICKGPSEAARDRFVLSRKEKGGLGFPANLFLDAETVSAIEEGGSAGESSSVNSLPSVSFSPVPDDTEPDRAEENEEIRPLPADDDGDGLILEKVCGPCYQGYMLTVLDPSRVILGCDPTSFGRIGHSIGELAEMYDAVAAIPADGSGAIPGTALIQYGEYYYKALGVQSGFAGFDSDYKLHTGIETMEELEKLNIQHGAGCGKVLVRDGEKCEVPYVDSGFSPRTAIGQRSDGACLMLVISGRQPDSMGATIRDLADIMADFGAENACSLVNGNASLMWLNGEYINNRASVIGTTVLPAAFLVLGEGGSSNG